MYLKLTLKHQKLNVTLLFSVFSNNPNNLPRVQNDQEPTEDIIPAQSFFSKPKVYYSRISEKIIKRPDGVSYKKFFLRKKMWERY